MPDPGGDDLSDADLAREVMAGERAAERVLCVRFARRIRLYGLKHLGTEEAAGDLVQQVLLHVLEALRAGRVEDPALVDRFILGTCRHVAGRIRRNEWRRVDRGHEVGADRDADLSVPEPVWVDRIRLERCLMGLPVRERRVIVMTFQDDCSADEIAGELRLSAGNVRVIRYRALRSLQTCIEAGP